MRDRKAGSLASPSHRNDSPIICRWAFRVWVNFHPDLLQETRLLQRLTPANNGVADNGIVLTIEAGREGLYHCLLFRIGEGAETLVSKEAFSGIPSWRRRLAKVGSSSPGGSGLRSHSQASRSSAGISSPLTTGSALCQSTQLLSDSRPKTTSAPAFKMRIRSHSSETSVWIGVAVASKRFFVRGPTRSMKSSRLLGSALFSPNPPRRRALCASSRTTVPNLRSSRKSRSSDSWTIRPVETMAIRNGQRVISSVPRVLIVWPL